MASQQDICDCSTIPLWLYVKEKPLLITATVNPPSDRCAETHTPRLYNAGITRLHTQRTETSWRTWPQSSRLHRHKSKSQCDGGGTWLCLWLTKDKAITRELPARVVGKLHGIHIDVLVPIWTDRLNDPPPDLITWLLKCIHMKLRFRDVSVQSQVNEWITVRWMNKSVCDGVNERMSSRERENEWGNACWSVYLFPDNDQHNEWDDDNYQQHQHSSRHSELWVRTWTHHHRLA